MSGRHARAFSFEFFPPKMQQGMAKLAETSRALAQLKPHYVSVTFGAGGSTREGTYQAVTALQQTTGLEVVPHLSCIGVTRDEVRPMLERYRAMGVRRIVALRGDLPKDAHVHPLGLVPVRQRARGLCQRARRVLGERGLLPRVSPRSARPGHRHQELHP